MKKLATAALAVLAALLLVACGSGGGGTTATAPAGTAHSAKPSAQHQGGAAKGTGDEATSSQGQGGEGSNDGEGGSKGGQDGSVPGDTSADFTPPSHEDSATGAAPFEAKGGDNSIQEFGAEASGSDFAAAATALHGYLDARAAGAWRDACSFLSPGVVASLAQLGGGSGRASCAEILASVSTGLPPAARREAAVADVGALRSEGDRAFLLFHGAGGADYFIPMTEEGGSWKVAALAASSLP